MGAVFFLALAAAMAMYGAVLLLPRYSPRNSMISRLGPQPLSLSEGPGREGRRRFRLLQVGLAGSAALVAVVPWLFFRLRLDWVTLAVYPLLTAAAAEAWFRLHVRRRKALIGRAYPDLLAHLATQTRAGAGMLQAFASAPPVLREPLRSEVSMLIADMGVAPVPAALERFAARCELPEIRAFVQNIIHQQALGISLAQALADEETHALAMARQAVRQRIQGSAITMAAVTVILLLNGLMIYFMPVLYDMTRTIIAR